MSTHSRCIKKNVAVNTHETEQNGNRNKSMNGRQLANDKNKNKAAAK